jgi:hypothetical protein
VDFSLADLGLKVFPVVILGGLDSVAGAIIGGVLIGVLENLGRVPRSALGGGVKEVAPFVAPRGDPDAAPLRPSSARRRDRARLMQCGGFRPLSLGRAYLRHGGADHRRAAADRGPRPRAPVRDHLLARRAEPDRHRDHRRSGSTSWWATPGRSRSARRVLAVGAYSTAILEVNAGLPFYPLIPLAALVTSGFGLVLHPVPAAEGLYLAIATLAAHFITTYGIVHRGEHDEGRAGVHGPPPPCSGCRSTRTRGSSTLTRASDPGDFFAKNLS